MLRILHKQRPKVVGKLGDLGLVGGRGGSLTWSIVVKSQESVRNVTNTMLVMTLVTTLVYWLVFLKIWMEELTMILRKTTMTITMRMRYLGLINLVCSVNLMLFDFSVFDSSCDIILKSLIIFVCLTLISSNVIYNHEFVYTILLLFGNTTYI